MRLPSLDLLLGEAARAARRFPFVLLMASAGLACALMLVDGGDEEALVRGLLAGILGIPLLAALALVGERRGGKPLLGLAGVTLVVLYYFFAPSPERFDGVARFIQFTAAALLMVIFLPHLGQREANGFWQFNKELLLRLLSTAIFTGVLIAGLSIALLALDKLFGLRIDGEVYARLDLTLLFLFASWHFLAGVPSDWAALERSADYPRGLKVFAQYVLAPLVAVYLALLLAYLVKVVVTTAWPSGWIGWLVSSVAAAGLFSLALLHPRIERPDSRWIAGYARLYFLLMLPATVMMLLALGKRIAQYGITENRYFMSVLALWLLGVCGAGALKRLRGLEPLPLTLCAVALLSSFGPWGAYSVSRASQTQRLEGLLVSADCLEAGRLRAPAAPVDRETRRELSAVLDYLVEHHGVGAIDGWLSGEQGAELANLADGSGRNGSAVSRHVMGELGLGYVDRWRQDGGIQHYSFQRRPRSGAIEIADYDLLLRPALFGRDAAAGPVRLARGDELRVGLAPGDTLRLSLARLLADLRGFERAQGPGSPPDSLMDIDLDADGRSGRLTLDALSWSQDESGAHIEHLDGLLLLRR